MTSHIQIMDEIEKTIPDFFEKFKFVAGTSTGEPHDVLRMRFAIQIFRIHSSSCNVSGQEYR